MDIATWTDRLLAAGLEYPLLLPGIIVLSTFVLEDATTILVGVWAATGAVQPEVALGSLYVGIVLGDFGLYGFGWLASLPRFSQRLVQHDRMMSLRDWLDGYLGRATFAVRFLPGLRLPAYTATGFFGMSFRRFATAVVLATAIWTTGLFTAAYFFGAATQEVLGVWRWPICLLPILTLFVLGRRGRRRVFARADVGS